MFPHSDGSSSSFAAVPMFHPKHFHRVKNEPLLAKHLFFHQNYLPPESLTGSF
jgi:hypothetical protein